MTIKEAQALVAAWEEKNPEGQISQVNSLPEEFWTLLSKANTEGVDLTEALIELLGDKNSVLPAQK